MKKISTLALITCIFSSPLLAGNYIGVSTGDSTISNISGLDNSSPSKIYYGVEDFRKDAVELSMTNLGQFNSTGSPAGNYISTSGIELTARLNSGSGPLKGFTKLGLYSWHSTLFSGGSLVVSDSGLGVTYGVGAAYNITDNLELNAEYQLYPDVSGIDYTLMGFGLIYRLQK